MITGIDHIARAVASIEQGAEDMAAVFGRSTEIDAKGGCVTSARLQLDNLAVRLHASGDTTEMPATSMRLVLAAGDFAATTRKLARRALPGAVRANEAICDIDTSVTHGVPISVAAASPSVPRNAGADIAGLDHIVIRTPDPERAVALYGGRLGLDLRLDRSNPAYGSRMLFFVCGGLVIEITHDLKAGAGSGPDRIWGLAWRANDIARAHARLTSRGVKVSEVRDGRRPGTQVFTVKSHTSGVPTLVIGGEGLQRS